MQHTITGTVIEGEKIGTTIGYPTANVSWVDFLRNPIEYGVYACFVTLEDNTQLYKGVLVVGMAPEQSEGDPKAEVHILDFNQNIYNMQITIDIVQKLRDLAVFKTTEELIHQIKEDISQAKGILGSSI